MWPAYYIVLRVRSSIPEQAAAAAAAGWHSWKLRDETRSFVLSIGMTSDCMLAPAQLLNTKSCFFPLKPETVSAFQGTERDLTRARLQC